MRASVIVRPVDIDATFHNVDLPCLMGFGKCPLLIPRHHAEEDTGMIAVNPLQGF